MATPRPTVLLLAATVVSGASGYVANALVPAVAGVEEYAAFAVLWSAVFLVVGALGGVQQEVTRAATAPSAPGGARTLPVAVAATLVVGALVALLALVGLPALGVEAGAAGVVAATVGVAGYVVVAIVCGRLYGVSAWVLVAALIAIDGVLRLLGVAVALAAGGGIPALAWAIAAPFPLAPLLVLPLLVRALRGAAPLDVPLRRLGWNAARLVLAAAATALLLTGMPTVLRLGFPAAAAVDLAPVALALSLVRAPLLIPVLALQSLLIVRFSAAGAPRSALRLAAAIVGAGIVLAVLAALVGPAVLDAVYGPPFGADPLGLGLVVASSGALGALIVLAAALVAGGRHGATLLAWGSAVAGTLVLLALPLPLPFGIHAGVAMTVGAAAGVVAASVALVRQETSR